MKSMIGLFQSALEDLSALSGASTCPLDIEYVRRRVKHEGMSFWTMTLPTFRDALDRGLAEGRWPQDLATAFSRSKNQSLPRLFSGLTRLVFNLKTGKLLQNPDIRVIVGLRQACSLFKKVELDCSPERVFRAYKKYLTTDLEVKPVRELNKIDLSYAKVVFSSLFGSVLTDLHHSISEGMLSPRHGTGAVAEGFSPNEKFSAPWYDRLSPIFPPDWYLVPFGDPSYLSDVEMVGVGHELPARIAHVPKTLKTPRLIAMEPTAIQYCQQALMRFLYNGICSDPVVKDIINLRDQSVNAEWALRGSEWGHLATIDLSEASDRVGAGLVSALTRPWPLAREALFRARSSRVSMKMGTLSGVYRLRKFASMGSATCFPIESMVFTTIVIVGMLRAEARLPSTRNIRECAKSVRVFGDDLVVPTHLALAVEDRLESFGLKVNRSKSFSSGFFRESCGVDAFRGYNVTPVYVRHLFPSSLQESENVVSMVSTCNLFHKGGMWRCADFIRRQFKSRLRVRLPLVLESSPALGLVSYWSKNYEVSRQCDFLHRPEIKALLAFGANRNRPLVGFQPLVKSLLRLEQSDGVLDQAAKSYSNLRRDLQVESRGDYLSLLNAGSTALDIDDEPRRYVLRLIRSWTTPF